MPDDGVVYQFSRRLRLQAFVVHQELAAYLFELVYDLMIGDDAVSTNPGFESVIRFYGRSDHDAD